MPNSLSAGRGRRCGCAACIRRPVFEIAAGYHQNASPSTSFGPEAASFAGMRRALSKAAYAASAMLGRQCAASSEAGAVDEKQTGKRHFDASPYRSRHGKNLLQAERDGALVAGQAFFLAARALEGRQDAAVRRARQFAQFLLQIGYAQQAVKIGGAVALAEVFPGFLRQRLALFGKLHGKVIRSAKVVVGKPKRN